jgi:hypothetical protein
MKPTDFSLYLTQFLSDYLPGQKNVSPNTIRSYRDTFKLLLQYFQEREEIPPEKITLSCLIQERVISFLSLAGNGAWVRCDHTQPQAHGDPFLFPVCADASP